MALNLGFGFVPFPREIWEKSIDLTLAEFRLLGWFLLDLKLGIAAGCFTDKEVLDGNEKKPRSGLSRNSLKQARDGLSEKGFLTVTQVSYYRWEYQLKVSNSDTLEPLKVSNSDTLTPSKVSTSDTAIRKIQISTEKNSDSPLFDDDPESQSIFSKPIDEVWAHYMSFESRTPRLCSLTPKRKSLLKRRYNETVERLKDSTQAVAWLKCAITAVHRDPWHREKNVLSVEYIFRSQEQMEKFWQLYNRQESNRENLYGETGTPRYNAAS